MSLSKREHPGALADLRDAAIWYDGERQGLGTDFIDAVDEAVQKIVEAPLSAPVFSGGIDKVTVRSMRIRVFPYRVLYYLTDSSIVILAYAHHRRHPTYWQQRTQNGP